MAKVVRCTSDGTLTVIDSIFMNNQGAPLGARHGRRRHLCLGSKNGVLIVEARSDHNAASNAGAVGCLFAELDVYNSLFTNNTAIANGANNDDATQCSAINNGQHEMDQAATAGRSTAMELGEHHPCGDAILNTARARGVWGGLFFTSNDRGGTLSIATSPTRETRADTGRWLPRAVSPTSGSGRHHAKAYGEQLDPATVGGSLGGNRSS